MRSLVCNAQSPADRTASENGASVACTHGLQIPVATLIDLDASIVKTARQWPDHYAVAAAAAAAVCPQVPSLS
jgi:hypothetical protein